MSHMILVQAEVDEQTKSSAEKWLRDQGIFPDEAIRIFYRQVVACHGLPFHEDRRQEDPVIEAPFQESAFYGEVSAVNIPSVTGELRDAHQQGREILGLLTDYKEQRALRKAARRSQRKKPGPEAGQHLATPRIA
jgi:addiction module RelB/DinJ family antitoxin